MHKIIKTIIVKILTWEAKLILAKYQPRLIGVTGSVGKTSTKDAIFAVVEHFVDSVRKSQKSYNSETGAPLTIIEAESPFGGWASLAGWLKIIFKGLGLLIFSSPYPKWLVLEIGADRPGDIKNNLAHWLKFEAVVVTALPAVPVHVEFFASPEAVWAEKLSLLTALKPGGVTILNYDDQQVMTARQNLTGKVITYGTKKGADLVASNYHLTYSGENLDGLTFKVDCAGNSLPVRLKGVVGEHHIYPALAALAVAHAQSWNLLEAVTMLEKHEPTPGRMRILSGLKNTTIIDDTYNSSPSALSAALAVLKQAEASKKIAVLGDMLELGNFTISAHEEGGRQVATIVDELYLIGLRAKFMGEAAIKAGFPKDKVHYLADVNEAASLIPNVLTPNRLILVKGSQALRLEKIVALIMREPNRAGELLVRQNKEWLAR